MTESTPRDTAEMTETRQKGQQKTARVPIELVPGGEPLRKPAWIRVKAGNAMGRFGEIKRLLRGQKLHTVCEEAACPNVGECFGRGTAAFMILGDLCTRRCPFCDVGHGRPLPPDPGEPARLAESVARLGLRYVVITSVDRDDLRDGGAGHFADVVAAVREVSPATVIETLVPDFRGRMDAAIDALGRALPDVLNHNLETVPRLYRQARPGADYVHSLAFLRRFKERHPRVPTKSGLMVGLGETDEEILAVMRDLRVHDVDMLTIGQYLAPSPHHLPVVRYARPDSFELFENAAKEMGFAGAACGPMVRSSYWADRQAQSAGIVQKTEFRR
ncbi:MAG: lipoyl synthase [Candidatus Accumulibacter sp.]|jgi:lipoic acid synthetase|nr:lipoyl synthase [Accumulibacter sp.]